MNGESPPGRPAGWALALIALLEVAWLGWFLLEPLPNAGNAGKVRLNRGYLLIRALPEVAVPGLKFRESYLGLALAELSHVENLPQRLPIVGSAGLIAASAVALGLSITRALRLRSLVGRWEGTALAYGLGTTALGLVTLVVGRLGGLTPWSVRVGLLVPIVAEAALAWSRKAPPRPEGPVRCGAAIAGFAALAGPFLLIMLLGAMLPTIDFDAIEYHVQGPKEYFQAGRIAFLPHNVYTSMPFGVEMLHLLGMELVDDWWLGALVGQFLVALYAPMGALLIGATALRLGSGRAAWVAAVAYLTTPWVYRLAVLPYVEGPLCSIHAALIWAVVLASRRGVEERISPENRPSRAVSLPFLVGLLAGGAMAIKYPALLSAVVPASAWAARDAWRHRDARGLLAFVVGFGLVMTPWLVKNVRDTGNPVYPLGYQVFGARHWDPSRDARWSAAHGPKPVEAGALARSLVDVAGRSDWQSPLFAALAPLAFLRIGSRRAAGWLAAFAAYLFLTWWLFTHRLDRFWLPILPPLAVLAGLGSDWARSKAWTALLGSILVVSVATNAVYSSTALAGLNEWTGDLVALRSGVPRMLNPPLTRLDAGLPPGAKPLLVGQAAVFHLDRPVVYNTVFNEETIEVIARGRTPREVGAELRRRGITHVYVDWFEVERYRSPGNYGFTPFVTPGLFAGLVEAGILRGPRPLGANQDLYEVLDPR